ncbi:MAG: hypothetical protein GYB49_08675 [Alphaproteobacteria bacterium]|nr:hypothetical protein [Hyphomonas sp.]MBR9807280.1 hypothetical protein [Alphaproteobacteria bacterium]|tara:strand:- start:6625 stop:7335 length:711 start_codon:yes stop_codon:yes gene_type:complete
MLEFITQGPDAICTAVAEAGIRCDQPLFVINLWNLTLSIVLGVLTFMLVRLIMNYRGLETHEKVFEMKVPMGALPEKRMMRLNPYTMAKLVGEDGYEPLKYREAGTKLNEAYGKKYFVVQFQEGGNNICRTEVRLKAAWFPQERNAVRVDAETLTKLKIGSASKSDDGTSDSIGVDGQFDIFAREVRWWDVRHWLFHPNREIRYALYVALFAATLEYSSPILGLVGHILKAPTVPN